MKLGINRETEETSKRLGELIIQARGDRSQHWYAKNRLDVTQTSVSKWERGLFLFEEIPILEAIASDLELSGVDELMARARGEQFIKKDEALLVEDVLKIAEQFNKEELAQLIKLLVDKLTA